MDIKKFIGYNFIIVACYTNPSIDYSSLHCLVSMQGLARTMLLLYDDNNL